MKLKMNTDCLILDLGLDKEMKDRFICFATGDGLVNEKGIKSQIAQKLSVEAIVNEAKKAGVTIISDKGCAVGGDTLEYRNDAVLAYNGGDTVLLDDALGNFMLTHKLAEPTE